MALFNVLAAAIPGMEKIDIPMLVAVALGLVLLIAFCIGFSKGARKVSWGGLVWIGACLLFGFVGRDYGAGLVDSIHITMVNADGVVYDLSLLIYLAVAVASVLVVLLVYGILSLIFRGKISRKAKRKDSFSDESEDDHDFEWEDEYSKTVEKETAGPSMLGRFLGGVFCLLNVVTIIVMVLFIAVLLIDATAVKNALAAVYEIAVPINGENQLLMPMLVDIAKRNGMDMLLIGVMIAVASRGRRKGLLESLRTLCRGVGNVALVVVCLYIPFSGFIAGPEANQDSPLYKAVIYLVNLTVTAMGPEMEMISPIIGQIFAGVVLAAAVSIVMMVINFFWRKFNFAFRKLGLFRGLDGSLSCLVYLVIGAVVCVGIFALLVVLDYFKVISSTALFSENAPISSTLYDLCDVMVRPFIEGLMAAIKF